MIAVLSSLYFIPSLLLVLPAETFKTKPAGEKPLNPLKVGSLKENRFDRLKLA